LLLAARESEGDGEKDDVFDHHGPYLGGLCSPVLLPSAKKLVG
jgi:hypothetical protein